MSNIPTAEQLAWTGRFCGIDPAAEAGAGGADDGKALPATDADLFFDRDSAKLTADDQASLQSYATAYLQAGGTAPIAVDGYASVEGPGPHNSALSDDRAKAVAKFLTTLGVPAKQMKVTAHGASAAFSADDPKQNRRVSLSPKPAPKPAPPAAQPAPDGAPHAPEPPAKTVDLGVNPPHRPTITLSGDPPPPYEPPFHLQPDDDSTMLREMDKKAAEIAKHPPQGRTVAEALGDAAVDVLKPVIDGLPISDANKKKIRDAIRDGAKSGSEKPLDAAVDALTSGPEADAIKGVFKALLNYRPGGANAGGP